jgi:hypothetical protein
VLTAFSHGESVSVSEAHLWEEVGFTHSLGDQVNRGSIEAIASASNEQFNTPSDAFSRVTLDSAKHQFHLGASVAVFDVGRVWTEERYFRVGKARAFHEEKIHFSSVAGHRNVTVHLRFKLIGVFVDSEVDQSGGPPNNFSISSLRARSTSKMCLFPAASPRSI